MLHAIGGSLTVAFDPLVPPCTVAMAAAGNLDPAPPPKGPAPVPAPAKGVYMRRIFPFLLATNVFIGVFVFAKTYKRDQDKKNAVTAAASVAPAAPSCPTLASETSKAADHVSAPAPKKIPPPISEDEQRQLYKWMLEEKRKIKPHNAAEKNKINEEKALLKEFIRAESLPNL